ncbi:MAG: hypothetical protein KZQ95_22130 [Candidatus Thiodiazotropha sp. (ex Epidulcina cf. delphinae)]|nr:hypothetical protein [Candidatus Thiodiazotropha sp. (ex Epidulcina cf. delphinae)]
MKAKLITSSLLGFMLPWTYFLVVNVGPIRIYDQFGKESVGSSGVLGFIEFNGLLDALIIYAKAALACALVVFIVCVVYDVIAGKYATKP